MKLTHIFLPSVADLPTIHTSDFRSAVALPSISGDGAYLLSRDDRKFYELTCDETNCSWTVMPHTADNYYRNAMYLPSDYFC